MPATNEPAIGTDVLTPKSRRIKSLIVEFLSTRLRYPIISGFSFNLLNKSSIDELREPSSDVLTTKTKVEGYHAGLLGRQLLTIRQTGEDPVISSTHPLREIPDVHCCRDIPYVTISSFGYYYYGVISDYVIVISYKWVGEREASNDSPGVLAASEEAAGRGYGPRPVGRGTTTMCDNNAAALKSRQLAAAQIEIDARDVLAGRWDNVRMEAGR